MIRSATILSAALAAMVSTHAFAEGAVSPSPVHPSTTPVAVEEPRDIVAAIYRLALADLRKANAASPFFDRAARAKYFSKSFDVLVTSNETEAAHEGAAAIDFDPITASQDSEIKNLTLKTDLIDLTKAIVSASFVNHGQPTVVTYAFVKQDGAWKVDDIRGTTEKEAWSVRKILKDTGRPPQKLPGMPGAAKGADADGPQKAKSAHP